MPSIYRVLQNLMKLLMVCKDIITNSGYICKCSNWDLFFVTTIEKWNWRRFIFQLMSGGNAIRATGGGIGFYNA
jgi:hypothetical protein